MAVMIRIHRLKPLFSYHCRSRAKILRVDSLLLPALIDSMRIFPGCKYWYSQRGSCGWIFYWRLLRCYCYPL